MALHMFTECGWQRVHLALRTFQAGTNEQCLTTARVELLAASGGMDAYNWCA
jgi:hypothetical protein